MIDLRSKIIDRFPCLRNHVLLMKLVAQDLRKFQIDQEHELWFGDCENDVVFEPFMEMDM